MSLELFAIGSSGLALVVVVVMVMSVIVVMFVNVITLVGVILRWLTKNGFAVG